MAIILVSIHPDSATPIKINLDAEQAKLLLQELEGRSYMYPNIFYIFHEITKALKHFPDTGN